MREILKISVFNNDQSNFFGYCHVAVLVLYYTISKYPTKVYESFIENQDW